MLQPRFFKVSTPSNSFQAYLRFFQHVCVQLARETEAETVRRAKAMRCTPPGTGAVGGVEREAWMPTPLCDFAWRARFHAIGLDLSISTC